jgi:hypothetical protein
MNVRTSVADPLLVRFIEGLSLPGRLALTMAPGEEGFELLRLTLGS